MYPVFNQFSSVSGLKENISKSSIYFGGLNNAILDEFQFSKGSFPFKYLGVPLSSKKLFTSYSENPWADLFLPNCYLMWEEFSLSSQSYAVFKPTGVRCLSSPRRFLSSFKLLVEISCGLVLPVAQGELL